MTVDDWNRNIAISLRFLLDGQSASTIIAVYFTPSAPPQIGAVVDITRFKQAPEYPDRVRVLHVEQTSRDETSSTLGANIYNIRVEEVN